MQILRRAEMTSRTVDDFLLLTDDQIDYASLDLGMVAQLATQRVEPFIATSALHELSRRDPATARDAAEGILGGDLWDHRLAAYALYILFNRDAESGIAQMARLLERELEQPIVDAMIESVMYEPARFRAGIGRLVLQLLGRRLRAVPAKAFDNPQWAAAVIALAAEAGS
jgi:hypothetical protein